MTYPPRNRYKTIYIVVFVEIDKPARQIHISRKENIEKPIYLE